MLEGDGGPRRVRHLVALEHLNDAKLLAESVVGA